MKKTSPVRTAFLASVLALAGAGVVLAQDAAPTTPTTPPATPPSDNSGGGGGGGGHHGWMNKVLTPEEQALLKKDTEAVFAADPDLKKEGDDLKSQRPDQDASDDDKQAFRAKMKDYHQKVEAAVEKFDPSTTPIYAKLDAAMAARHNGGGGGGGGQ
jgi:hypothetical protein